MDKQIILLRELAKKLKKKKRTKKSSLKSLEDAGILKDGDFSSNYKELKKFNDK